MAGLAVDQMYGDVPYRLVDVQFVTAMYLDMCSLRSVRLSMKPAEYSSERNISIESGAGACCCWCVIFDSASVLSVLEAIKPSVVVNLDPWYTMVN